MSTMPRPENTCPDCGQWKKEEYDQCYNCSHAIAEDEGRVCVCGNRKQPEYDVCYECRVEEKKNSFESHYPAKQ
jgi:hypothetical protein